MGIIRFLLAMSVVVAHIGSLFGFSLVGGRLAVQLFYIISGFYMSLILNEKYTNSGSYRLFIGNRLLRLFPTYWAVLLLTVTSSLFMYNYFGQTGQGTLGMYIEYSKKMDIWSMVFLFFTNFFLFFQDIVMFLGLNIENGTLFFTNNFHLTTPHLYRFLFLPQAWTLGIELMFYLVAPFIVRKSWKFILLLFSLSVFLRIYLISRGLIHDPWSYRFFPTELAFFLLGSLSYVIYRKIILVNIKTIYLRVSFFFILFLIFFFSFIPGFTKELILIGSFFLLLPFIFLYTKKWKRSNYLGELSYPVYISHMFILETLILLGVQPSSIHMTFLLIVTTVVFSVLLDSILIKKIEIIREKRVADFLTYKKYGTHY